MLLKRGNNGSLSCSECFGSNLLLTHDEKGKAKGHGSNLQAECCECGTLCWLLEEDEMGMSDEFSEFLHERLYTGKTIPFSEVMSEWKEKDRLREEATTREEDEYRIKYKYKDFNGYLYKTGYYKNETSLELDHSCDSWIIGDIDETWQFINDLRYIMEKLENERRKRK